MSRSPTTQSGVIPSVPLIERLDSVHDEDTGVVKAAQYSIFWIRLVGPRHAVYSRVTLAARTARSRVGLLPETTTGVWETATPEQKLVVSILIL